MKKMVFPLIIVGSLFSMAFIGNQQQKYVTVSKDGNYNIPAKVLSYQDANQLLKLTTIYANGSEVCERSIARDVAERRCVRTGVVKENKDVKAQVDQILQKYMKK